MHLVDFPIYSVCEHNQQVILDHGTTTTKKIIKHQKQSKKLRQSDSEKKGMSQFYL